VVALVVQLSVVAKLQVVVELVDSVPMLLVKPLGVTHRLKLLLQEKLVLITQ
jgi:hypothetical protein